MSTLVVGFRAHPKPGCSHAQVLNEICKDSFQTRSLSQLLGKIFWRWPPFNHYACKEECLENEMNRSTFFFFKYKSEYLDEEITILYIFKS